jgi:hypothetical protein
MTVALILLLISAASSICGWICVYKKNFVASLPLFIISAITGILSFTYL